MKHMTVIRSVLKRTAALALCLTLALAAAPQALAASKTLNVSFTVTTYQNRARAALKQINALRKANGAGELVMTSELENLSIQRAAELFVLFDHDRPNLKEYDTAGSGSAGEKTRQACAELVAAGYSSADKLMEDWGEGSLTTLLDGDFTHAGIACVFVKGSYNEYYWEMYLEKQPESFKGKAAASTAKSGRSKSVSVEIASGMFTRADSSHKRFELKVSDINMKTKQTAEPSVFLYDRYGVKIGKCALDSLSYRSGNTGVFTVKASGTLRRVKSGSSTLTVSFTGLDSVKCAVTVGGSSASSGGNGSAVTAATIGEREPELTAKEFAASYTLSAYVKGASGYVLYRSSSKSGSYTKVDEKATTKRWSVKLQKDELTKAYYYKVRAYKNSGGRRVYSEYSAPVRVEP